MANVFCPVLLPVRDRERARAFSYRSVWAPVLVKLTVAAGVLPEASIVFVVLLISRICRFVLWAVDPVYWSVPPSRRMPTLLAASWAAVRAPRGPATP